MSPDPGRTTVLFAGGGTGGHLYPGIAIARTLVRLEPRVQPFFIGAKRGTGGTAGVAYLQATLGKRAFPELWSLRTRL